MLGFNQLQLWKEWRVQFYGNQLTGGCGNSTRLQATTVSFACFTIAVTRATVRRNAATIFIAPA